VAKTSIDPSGVAQLKKLFIENLDGKDTLVKTGKVKLANGKYRVNLPEVFTDFTVQITAIDTDASDRYVVDMTNKNNHQFTIVSSSASDSGEAMYLAIGG